jgi:hypothetical protein
LRISVRRDTLRVMRAIGTNEKCRNVRFAAAIGG